MSQRKRTEKKHRRSAKKVIQDTGRAMGKTTKEAFHASTEMVKHPKKSAIILMNSSGEVLGEMNEDMLKAQDLMLKRTKQGIILARGRAERLSGAETAKTRREYNLRFLFFFGPLVALILVYIMYFVLFPWDDALTILVGALLYLVAFPGFDKNTLILGANGFGLDPYRMAINISILDSLLGTFLCLNFDFAKRIPWIGTLITNFESAGRSMLKKYKWLNSFSLIGLFIFIVLPFQGSGAMAGAIIGRMIGLSNLKVIIAIVTGTFFGCLLIAYLAGLLVAFAPLWVQWAIPITIYVLLVAGVAYAYYKKKKKKRQEKKDRERLEKDAEEGLPS